MSSIDLGQQDRDLVLECAIDMIRTPSENPPGNETAVAPLLVDWLSELGFEVRRIDSSTGRPNISALLGNGSPHLVWNGHMDTVPAGEVDAWPHPPFEGVVKDGVLWGRGAADMKGAIAACLGAVSTLKRHGEGVTGTLEVLLVSDEESMGGHGSGYLAQTGSLKADACVVGEPTNLSLALAERGALWLRIAARGVASHGSLPSVGASAIQLMAHFITLLEETLPPIAHELSGKPSINVGTISGGTKVNMVAEACEALVDRRTIPGESDDLILTTLRDLAQEVAGKDDRLGLDIEVIESARPFEVDPRIAIAECLRRAVPTSHSQLREIGFPGFTDARFFHMVGIPVVLFGPGSLEDAHSSHEHVRVQDLLTATGIYAQVFNQFGRRA